MKLILIGLIVVGVVILGLAVISALGLLQRNLKEHFPILYGDNFRE